MATSTQTVSEPRRVGPSRIGEAWRRYASDGLAVAGLFVIVVVTLAAVFAPDVPIRSELPVEGLRRAAPGVDGHVGTDEVGRDPSVA